MVLMLGDTLPMLVPMDQGLRKVGPLPVLKVSQVMLSQPEQLRHRGSGKKEKSGEWLAHIGTLSRPVLSGQTPGADY
jgi:hypothetical protein